MHSNQSFHSFLLEFKWLDRWLGEVLATLQIDNTASNVIPDGQPTHDLPFQTGEGSSHFEHLDLT